MNVKRYELYRAVRRPPVFLLPVFATVKYRLWDTGETVIIIGTEV